MVLNRNLEMRALTLIWPEKGIRKGESDEGGDGEDEIWEELALIFG